MTSLEIVSIRIGKRQSFNKLHLLGMLRGFYPEIDLRWEDNQFDDGTYDGFLVYEEHTEKKNLFYSIGGESEDV